MFYKMPHMVARLLAALFVIVCTCGTLPAAAQTATDPIRYTLRFPAPHTHYVEVTAVVPTERRPTVELMMAVWTPGSYLVREYARHVEAVAASVPSGESVAVEKSDKNRWRVSTAGAPTVTITYRVYGREMSVRTNWIEADFAMLNGAPTFITLADGAQRPHEVAIEPARGWRTSMTTLAELPGGPHRYRALDFDTLVDSPIVIGNPAVYEFTIDNKKHYLVNVGEGGVFDGGRAVKDLEALVREHRRMWGMLPYDKYVFFNMLTVPSGGGGLEHKNSTMLMASRWTTRTRRAYLGWLALASHEFFHAWNVKRLRPTELGPFNYEDEALTRSLWIAEGVTDYYGDLAVRRAGLSTPEEHLDAVSNHIENLQTTPGRLVQSVEEASFDAWIKYYRPDENSLNASVSYYTKGAVLGFLLDAKIRKATRGAKSLDDVMRHAYEKFSGGRGFTPDEFRAAVEQVSGLNLRAFWADAIEGTAELDYTEALDVFGLEFKSSAANRGIWLGEFRVRADQLNNRLEQYNAGDKVTVLVARREQLLRLDVALGTEPLRRWRLDISPTATAAQNQQRRLWVEPGRAS
jgi:predicted metalloprotease with PDZ domain